MDKYVVPWFISVWKDGRVTTRRRRFDLYTKGDYYGDNGNYELKYAVDEDGCLMVNLDFAVRGSRQYVHRLVAEKYLPNPNNYEHVLFKDGNVKNCNVNNLEWCP